MDDPPRARVRARRTEQWGAYRFAWGFGFFQFLFEFGASSALQRQISEAWTRGDRDGVYRSIACGMTFYTGVAVLQVAALLGVAYSAPGDGIRRQGLRLIQSSSGSRWRPRPAMATRFSSRACSRPPAVRFHAAV